MHTEVTTPAHSSSIPWNDLEHGAPCPPSGNWRASAFEDEVARLTHKARFRTFATSARCSFDSVGATLGGKAVGAMLMVFAAATS
jgi:hypothetical protein